MDGSNKEITMKRKLLVILASMTVLGLSATAQAQQGGITGGTHLSDGQRRSKTMQVKQNKSRWNYSRQMNGLNLMMSQNNNARNCYNWAENVPEDHPQLNPYVFKALYDIAQFGTLYERTRLGQNIHPNDRNHYNRLRDKANEAMAFCSPNVIGAVPSNYMINANPNIAGGRTQERGGFSW